MTTRPRVQVILQPFLVLGIFGLTAIAVLGGLGPRGWLTSLAQHFPFYTGCSWLGLAILAWCAQWRCRWVSLLAGLGLLSLAWWATPWIPRQGPTLRDDAPELTVVWANLWHRHECALALVEWLDAQPQLPEVLAVAEVHEEESLALLKQRYPHGIHDLQAGIGLFGNAELQDLSSVWIENARPILRATWRRDGASAEVLASHALLPFGGEQEATFTRLAEMAQIARPVILVGDLNTTVWSSEMARLRAEGGLRDARAGYGPFATWRSKRLPLLRLPIDHVLLGGQVRVLRLQRGPDLGSDHWPLIARLRVGA